MISLAVRDRAFGLAVGAVSVSRARLTWKPRAGRSRSVELSRGVAALSLPFWAHVPAPPWLPWSTQNGGIGTIESLTRLLSSAPFAGELLAAPKVAPWVMDVCSHHVCNDGEIASNPSFVALLDDDRMICLVDGEETWSAVCGISGPWPDASARTLAAALVWLPEDALRDAISRVLSWSRLFTREQVKARRIHGNAHHLGDELDAVVLLPTRSEAAAMEKWLSS